MKYTTNKNLKLPEYTDVADVADLNENFEAIDEHMGETVTSENIRLNVRRISKK